MWRYQSVHVRSETEYLDQALERLDQDHHLHERARATWEGFCAQEPIAKEAAFVPQDPRAHAEGPFLDAHLMRMLVVLFAITEEKLHLIDLEEFRRLKGYEGEVDELEELIKEKAAFFEVFVLTHDLAKQHAIVFTAAKGSHGEHMDFSMQPHQDPVEEAQARTTLLSDYRAMFDRFGAHASTTDPRVLQKQFYDQYEIRIAYPHHDRMMYAPVQKQLIERVARAHQLSDRDTAMLLEINARHLEFEAFHQVHPSMVYWLLHLANKNGFDGDDFLDLVQGCIFLDWVCGSMRTRGQTTFHDPSYLINIFKSERQLFPERQLAKYEARERKKREIRNRFFQEVGLDGAGLMQLLDMPTGPEFGRVLKQVQQAILGQEPLPHFSTKIDQEIKERSIRFYNKLFGRED